MNINITNKNEELVMSLVHYFITEENYTPIIVKGVADEIWLEKVGGPYRIIRINSNHIINEEQYRFDMYKAKKVMSQIKKKTLSFHINALNILLNASDNVKISEDKNIATLKIDDINELTSNENFLEIFPNVKDKVIKDKKGIDLIINVTNDINLKTRRENISFSNLFSPKKIIITPILICLCVLVFIATYLYGGGSEDVYTLIKFGASYTELIKMGEVWRLFTCIFLHAGIAHLLCNMYALYIFGKQIESFLGKTKYLIIFLGSGIIGSLLSAVLEPSVSVGASGAIFGLLGSLLYFGYHYRLYLGSVLKTQIIPIIIINLLVGFCVSNIANFAHIGGLCAGYLLTMALGIPGKTKKKDMINGWIVIILLVLFLSYALVRYA